LKGTTHPKIIRLYTISKYELQKDRGQRQERPEEGPCGRLDRGAETGLLARGEVKEVMEGCEL
jgi:hypothetical protein